MRIKNKLGLIMALALVLLSLGQAALAAPAANVAAIPSVLTTVTNVGATPTGIAVDPVHNYIYVSSRDGNHLTRINGDTWGKAYSATSGVVYHPMGLAVNPTDQRVYVCNTDTEYLSVVDGYSLSLVYPIYMGSGNIPMDVVLNPDLGYAFASDFNRSRAYAVQMSTLSKINIENVAPGGTKVAQSADGKLVYVSCYSSNAVDVIDTANHRLLARYYGHYDHPVGIAVNPANGYLYVANANNGSVSVVDDRNDLKHIIYVGGTIKGVAYNPNTNHLFVTRNGIPGQAYVYDGTSYGLITTLTLQNNPDAYMAVDLTRNRVYVTNQGSGSVSVIQDTVTTTSAPPAAAYPLAPDQVTSTPPTPDEPAPSRCPYASADITVSTGPQGIAVDDTHDKAYVADGANSTISRLNLSTNTVEETSTPGLLSYPTAMAVKSDNQRVYVANTGVPAVIVLDGAALDTMVTYIPLLQRPKYIYLVPEAGNYRAFVANHSDDLNTNYVSEIDTYYNSKIRDIVVGKGPYAITLSHDREIAYVTCHDSWVYGASYLSVIDVSLGKEVAQFFAHYNQPTDIVLDPTRDRMYVANEGSGNVIAIDHRNLVKGTVTMGGNPRALALSPAFERLAVLQKSFNQVSFLSTATFAVESCPPVQTWMPDRWMAFSAQHNRFYASRTSGNVITVIQDYVGDGYENDDSYTMAKSILNNITQVHSIDPANDQDWIKFNVSQPMTLTFVTTDTYPAIYTTQLALYGTNGITLLTSGVNHIDDYAFATTGTYYLKVTATNPTVGAANYTYQLRFTGGLPSYQLFLPLVLRQPEED